MMEEHMVLKTENSLQTGVTARRHIPLVFVVDDDVSVREALESLIRTTGWQCRTFASAEEFLAQPRVLTPGCLILDVMLPDLDGLDLQALIADRAEMPVIFITGFGDVSMTVRAMKAGAMEFLTKPFRDEVILGAIRSAVERSLVSASREASLQTLRERYAAVSHRERQVMALVVQGRLNKLIGAELGISEATVKAHRGKMMRKMNAHSVAELVDMATRLCPTPTP